ncbi:MAG: single-stranded-DNA-specific exonuclease RecJ [Clostridia bacterium]|nr:single-stranded-DNA-specific exonuclease RecJ [Clostridia bacterium]
MNKIWKIKEIDNAKVKEYTEKFKISEVAAKMLLAKDLTEDKIDEYLNPSIDKLHDPYLLNDMDVLVDRIILAKTRNEKVAIYGDYDVDGITSITLIYTFLRDLGLDMVYYLPDRIEEGYGLNTEALKKLKDEGVSLVITVDCGISAVSEVEYAKSIGLDVCITDHHECSDTLPNAISIVNPKRPDSTYPFNSLAGVGVTFKVLSAIVKRLGLDENEYLKYLDIAAVGTIADIVPLVGENRIITANGLELLAKTKNEGLKALMKVARIEKVDSDNVSFGIAPRINASGRMADATVAVKMLLAENEMEAYKYAKVLDSQNTKRQEVEKGIYNEAIAQIEKEGLDKKKTMVIAGEKWHQGVIGIVASKLTEKYLKPVILLAYDGETAKGSGRIPAGISLYDALSNCSDLLTTFGGHELAAGLTLETKNIEAFIEKFEQVITSMREEDFVRIIDIDTEITKKDVTLNILDDINLLAPFGQKNKKPVFMYKNLKVTSVSTLKEDKHLKFRLSDGDFYVDTVFFGAGNRRDEVTLGDKIDVAVNISLNDFQGRKSIQFLMSDFKKSMM